MIRRAFNKNDGLLKQSMVVLAASFIVNVLNYIFQVYMGRALGPAEYSVFGALFSLIYVIVVSSGTIQTVVTRFTAEYRAKNYYGRINEILTGFLKLLSIVSVIFIAVLLILSRKISQFLNIENQYLILVVGIFGVITLFNPIFTGVLRGLQLFNWFAASSVISTFLKLFFGILLVSLGFGVLGALIAMNISAIALIIISIIPLAYLFRVQRLPIDMKNIYSYSIPVAVSTTLMILLVSIDIILVKHYFSAEQAGYYIAASTIAKIIWFASGAFFTVGFSKVTENYENGKETRAVLKSCLFYTALISLVGVLIIYIAPNFVVNMLFGSKYQIDDIAPLFSLALGLFSINNVLIQYNIAIKKFNFVYFLAAVFIVELLGIMLYHNLLIEVVKIIAVSMVLLLFYMIYYTRGGLDVVNNNAGI